MKKILIIEDDVDLSDNLNFHLKKNNYNTLIANNGEEGLKLSFKKNPDFIICDIMLPDFDGYQVLKTLKENDKTRYIPFIFMSAKSGEDNVRKGLSLGADDYLSKPFNISELLISIKNHIDRSNPVEYIILIIEDDKSLIGNLEIILKNNKFNVILANTGKKGLELAKINNPDLIISDLMLPDINGFEIIKDLKSREETKLIPFIFLSASAEESNILKGLSLGAAEYITKPFDSKDLVNKIKKTIEKRSELKEGKKNHDESPNQININPWLEFLDNKYYLEKNIEKKFQEFSFENITLISVNLRVCISQSATVFQNYLLNIHEIKKSKRTIIDFSNCVYIDSVFVGALIKTIKKIDLNKEDIIVIVDNKKLQSNMFLLANIERVFITYNDVQTAITNLN